ncbi:MAG: ABC transporter permease [Firmicutes bacterium]|nr:ABC transporter permease [Candidatus Colimorpha enterica]
MADLRENKAKEPLMHITKRAYMKPAVALAIRITAIVIAFLLSGVVSMLFIEKIRTNPGRILELFECFITGCFGTVDLVWKYFKNVSLLLIIALALTPAFKMHFWNIGAEGQVLVGALGSIAISFYMGASGLPNWLILILMLIVGCLSSIIWAVIPAIFKSVWNTNETLFTLMMNYIATYIVNYVLFEWVPTGNALGIVNGSTHIGWLPAVFNEYFFIIVSVLIITVILYAYLKYSKHGYELSVVGESENTARYIGINVKKVVLRTMVFSGLLCGIAGFLIASGNDHSITTESVGGRGFTAILVTWLANFNPFVMMITSAFVVFLETGAKEISTIFDVSTTLPKVIVGIVLFFFIASEFFIKYQIHFRKKKSNETEGK